MAIDTALKRRAALNLDPFDVVLPEPDGTLALADRWHLLRLYYGLSEQPGVWIPHRAADTTRLHDVTDGRLVVSYDTTRLDTARSMHWPGAD